MVVEQKPLSVGELQDANSRYDVIARHWTAAAGALVFVICAV